jgi:hypothetical protein
MEIISHSSGPLRKIIKAIEYRNLANLTYYTIKANFYLKVDIAYLTNLGTREHLVIMIPKTKS